MWEMPRSYTCFIHMMIHSYVTFSLIRSAALTHAEEAAQLLRQDVQMSPQQLGLTTKMYCYDVLQCVAVCCSVLRCVAACCSVLRCTDVSAATWPQHQNVLRVAVCCSVLQFVAVCCSVLQCVKMYRYLCSNLASPPRCTAMACCSVLQCVAVCCSVLRCVAVCCCVLLCVAVCCNVCLLCVAVRCSVL